MSDLRRWLPEPDLDLGRFRFRPGPTPPHCWTGRPEVLAELTDEELRERAEHLALRLLDAWREGHDHPGLREMLARVASFTDVGALLSGQERHDLGLPS